MMHVMSVNNEEVVRLNGRTLQRSMFFSLTPTFQIGARVVHTVSSQALRRHYSPHTQPQSNAQDMRQAT